MHNRLPQKVRKLRFALFPDHQRTALRTAPLVAWGSRLVGSGRSTARTHTFSTRACPRPRATHSACASACSPSNASARSRPASPRRTCSVSPWHGNHLPLRYLDRSHREREGWIPSSTLDGIYHHHLLKPSPIRPRPPPKARPRPPPYGMPPRPTPKMGP